MAVELKGTNPKLEREMNTTIYKFNTKAIDNHGYEYDVSLVTSQYKFGPILHIEGTGGRWFVKTLREDLSLRGDCTSIFIDFGANWFVTNFDEIMNELNAFEEAN